MSLTIVECIQGILASVTPICVVIIAYFQLETNKNQLKTNKHKLSLDLYNRRFAVYEKTLLYFGACYQVSIEQKDFVKATQDFYTAYNEAYFLFGHDSKAYKALTDFHNAQPASVKDVHVLHALMDNIKIGMEEWLNFGEIK